MLSFPGRLGQLSAVSMLMVLLCALSVVARGQDSISCTEFNEAAPPSSVVDWVNIERGRPFFAERVLSSGDRSFHEHDLVARDSAGRIYIEQHDLPWQFYSVSAHHDANTVWALGTINILDSFGGKSVYVVVGSRTAEIKQSCSKAESFKQSSHPYSYALTLLFIMKPAAGVSVEDLGNKRVEGFQARGIRITWLGTKKDGDWNGRPVRASETWRSDELGATLLMVSTDFREQVASQTALVNIKGVEPDASLFEVPSGYQISESQQRMLLPDARSGTKKSVR